jgi:AcrR family transcriptional regulator
MTELTKKEKEKEKRRNDILDAAEKLLREKSFEEITMDEIAERVTLSKGTLYLYFASKKELSLAIHHRSLEYIGDRFARVLAFDEPGSVLLQKMAMQYVDFIQENPRYMDMFMHNEMLLFPQEGASCSQQHDQNPEAIRCHEAAIRMFSYLTRCIQVGMADGSIHYKGEPKELAVIYWGGVRGMFHISYLYQKGFVLPSLDDIDLSFKSTIFNYVQLLERATSK